MDKVAKLVWFDFGVRVVVNENATDEEIYDTAIKKVVKDGITNHICMDHVTEILDDTECPYGPEMDINYTEADDLVDEHGIKSFKESGCCYEC